MTTEDAALAPGISVVVPVYNSQETLGPLVARLEPVLRDLAENHEILLVNDGSRDGSWGVIARLAEANDRVRGFQMMRNYGQHNAILCGVRAARYDVVVTMDDDLQHPPEEVPRLVERLAEGHDVVYGTPRELPHSWWRNATSRLTKWLFAAITGQPSIRDLNAFRAFRTDLRMAFADFRSPQLLFDVLLSWATTKFSSVRVEHHPRRVGRSNYNLRRLLNQAILLLTGFSTAPLKLASLVGFVATAVGFLLLAYVLAIYFVRGSLAGFPFLASTILLFGGLQLFTMGIFGEYLARIFTRSLDRPTYVVRRATDAAPVAAATGRGDG